MNITQPISSYIYGFLYNSCIYESAMETISLHRTKKGAYEAMNKFITKGYNEWREDGINFGKQEYKFGSHSAWRIETIELKD